MRGNDLIHKGRKRKTTTQTIQVSPNGQHEIENTHLTELPSSDYACQYEKDRLTGKITCMVCGEEGHYTCDCNMKNQEIKVRKNTIRSELSDFDKTSHATMTGKALALLSKSTCPYCHEDGHCADRCPRKKPSGESELHDDSYGKKKLSRELELCDITCFICQDKGHKSYSCPKKKPPGALELSNVTCLKCHAKEHYTYNCPKKIPPGEVEPYHDSHECQFKGGSELLPSRLGHGEEDHCNRKIPIKSQAPYSGNANHAAMRDKEVTLLSKLTCFNCHEEGHRAKKCPRMKPPEDLETSDVTCFKCHGKGHKSYSCPKNSTGGLETSDVTCFKCHGKGHKSYSCPKKSPEELELSDGKSYSCPNKKSREALKLSDATCFRCHGKGHYMYCCPTPK
ncbi:hypothetical protein HU200_047857 [Digitaria exilis]|uniref:CCHC-type domain-containing protein n=1 Tax=Digitaria exilis TaxID=1010633 RepID=A0A835E857_9POAL|nr:hypothetical protein HU200_047857 [Digitaria exilis]